MKLNKFDSENYFQYGGVEENGTEVALITETVERNNMEREIIVDSNGFAIFEIDTNNPESMDHSFIQIEMTYGMACSMVEAMTVDMMFGFVLEEI